MGVQGGAVTGDGKMIFWYEAVFHGRQDGCIIKEMLHARLKVKRDILSAKSCFSIESVILGFASLALCFPLGLVGLSVVLGDGKQFVTGVQVRFRCTCP